MNPEITRAEQRQSAYGRQLRRACGVSLVAHALLALAVNPALILDLFRPDVPLGYPGRSQRGALTPLEQGSDKYTLYRVRRYSGPVNLTRVVVLGNRPPQPSPDLTKGEPTVGQVGKGGARERAIGGRTGGSVNSPVFELGEDWSMVQRSGAPAHSEKFQALKMVRPSYPERAIQQGVQGIVKLRVEVDTTGTVIDARAVENSAKSEDLANASINAMLKWEFRPYHVESVPVPFTVLVPFRYRLLEAEEPGGPDASRVRARD